MRGFLGLLIWGSLAALLAQSGSEDDLRAGNRAYSRGDYEGALDAYRRAADRTNDPGLVSFCRAAAHYQLQQFEEAAAAYRQSLEDAAGTRRAASQYGLGNALARQGELLPGRQAVPLLQLALEAYRGCVQSAAEAGSANDLELMAAAIHNAQQVEALLLKKRTEPQTVDPPPSDQEPASASERSTRSDVNNQEEPQQGPTEAPSPGQAPRETQETRPGKGNLPPLLDNDSTPPLSSAEAAEHLRRHLERIRKDASRLRSGNSATPTAVRDW